LLYRLLVKLLPSYSTAETYCTDAW